MKTYLTKVVADEDGTTVLLFPEELIKAMSLKENEILEVNVEGDQIVFTRKNFIDTKTI